MKKGINFSKLSIVFLSLFLVGVLAKESFSRSSLSSSTSSKRAGGSSVATSSKRAGSSSAKTSSTSKRAGSSSTNKRAGASSTTKRVGTSRSSSRGGVATSSRAGGTASKIISSRAGIFFSNDSAGVNAVQNMLAADDPQTQAEAECMTNYATCMDMLIPYVISQNPFLRDSAEVKYMQDADHDLRFVYDTTPVSEDGTDCTGRNCAEDSKTSVLYRNYNFFCSEGGMSTARDCRNIGGEWNREGYSCYDVEGSGYTGNYEGTSSGVSPAYAKPDSRNNKAEFEKWSHEESICKEYGGVWSQCKPKDNDVMSTSLKSLRRCYYDKESYLSQKGSRSSTAYYQELKKRLDLPVGDPNGLKVVDLGRTIISALGFNTDDMPKIGNSNFSFAVSVTPPATMLNSSVSLAEMDDICFSAKDGDDEKVEDRIRLKSKKLASESYYGELVSIIKEIAGQEYVENAGETSEKTIKNACKSIRGNLKKFYSTGISSILIKDKDTCNTFLGDWSNCYNSSRPKDASYFYSYDKKSQDGTYLEDGEEVCVSRSAKWDTEQKGYCVWDKEDESVCELFGGNITRDDDGTFKSCDTTIKMDNSGDCEKYGYFWIANGEGSCNTKNDGSGNNVSVHSIALETNSKTQRIEIIQDFDTPRKSSAKYESALQAQRLQWKSAASDYIMANAGKIENDIKKTEMADLKADAELANEMAGTQQEILEKCNDSLNKCIYKDSICGENGVNCIDADGFKSSKLSMVGMSCYPTYQKCVGNIISTLNKAASPFLSEYLQSFNGDMYWNLAKESLAASLSERYISQLEESCSASGGYNTDGKCYIPMPTFITQFENDGEVNYGDSFECNYMYTIKEKKPLYWFDEFEADGGSGWCTGDAINQKNKAILTSFANSYPVNNSCMPYPNSDTWPIVKKSELQQKRVPVAKAALEKAGVDPNLLPDITGLQDAARPVEGKCKLVTTENPIYGLYRQIDDCRKKGRKNYNGYGRVYYSTMVDATSEPKQYEVTLANDVKCSPGVFKPKGWNKFEEVEISENIKIPRATSLYCDAIDGTKYWGSEVSEGIDDEGNACDLAKDEGCGKNPITEYCEITNENDYTPMNYMMGEIMEAMLKFDGAIDSSNSNR